jgi:DNA-binding MarR family transcriptional regulator
MSGPLGAEGVEAPDPRQLAAYFALTEAASLLQHQIEQHLRTEGGLSSVQFQLLARLASDGGGGELTMTQLADGVVYSRSGLTYQAGLLEKAGLITRGPSPDDERATLVTITDEGRALVARILPGHVRVVRRLLLDPLSDEDVGHLGDIMTRLRDHMRAQPPRSAAPRKPRRPTR